MAGITQSGWPSQFCGARPKCPMNQFSGPVCPGISRARQMTARATAELISGRKSDTRMKLFHQRARGCTSSAVARDSPIAAGTAMTAYRPVLRRALTKNGFDQTSP